MRSRYDYMQQGKVRDEVTGAFYPDPLTFNSNNLKLKSIPVSRKLSENDILSFPREVYEIYKQSRLDDVILTLNGCPHANFLEPGDIIYFPADDDLQSSFYSGR